MTRNTTALSRHTSQSSTTTGHRFGYTGRELDEETGLLYYRARYYDSTVGRFISEDPIGVEAEDTNLYRYVGNSPTNATDPEGLYLVPMGDDPCSPPSLALSPRLLEEAPTLVAGIGPLIMPLIRPLVRFGQRLIRFLPFTRPTIRIAPKQLQSKFKHAKDFGVSGNYNPANARQFEQAIKSHTTNPGTQVIKGTYRGQKAIHLYNPKTGLNVITQPNGNFVSGWKLSPKQTTTLFRRKSL